MGDERPEKERYQRASLLDQVRDELVNLWHQPKVLLVIAVIVGGWLVLQLTTPAVVKLEELAVGDCIYVPTSTSGEIDAIRPIGSAIDVVGGLYRAGAERAPCDGSHGHEVAAVFLLEEPVGAPFPGAVALEARQRPVCEAAFEPFVGRPMDGSALQLTLAVPGEAAWDDGRRVGVCLVNNADGSFLTGRAAGSGR
jgi:Septum formation